MSDARSTYKEHELREVRDRLLRLVRLLHPPASVTARELAECASTIDKIAHEASSRSDLHEIAADAVREGRITDMVEILNQADDRYRLAMLPSLREDAEVLASRIRAFGDDHGGWQLCMDALRALLLHATDKKTATTICGKELDGPGV